VIIFKINLSTTISMKRPRGEVSIDMFVKEYLNNQITLFPYFIFIPETGLGLPIKQVWYHLKQD